MSCRPPLLFMFLLACLSCRNVSKQQASDLNLSADCRFLQRFGSLPMTCGNNKCEALIENQKTCPQDCMDPKTRVVSYYAQAHVCAETTVVHSPQTLAELKDLVPAIKKRNKGIKLVGSLHSSSDIKCPNGAEVIAMGAFQKIIGIEDYKGTPTVHLEANTRFWDLLNYLDEKGFALDKRFPGFGGISVAGFIATGAHGSDTKGSATISSSIASLEFILADGSVKVFDASNTTPEQWQALRANLGVFGVMTRVRLKLRPRYNMAMKIIEHDESVLFKGKDHFLRAIEPCDFLFAHYVRGMKKVYFTCGKETQEPESHPGFANELFLPPTQSAFNNLAVPSFQQAACSDQAAKVIESTIAHSRKKNPWLRWKDESGKVHSETEGVGAWHRSMEAIFDAKSQPKFSQIDWEVAIPMRNFEAAMNEMKVFMERNNVILPAIGVILRLDQAQNDSLMAPSAADEQIAAGEKLVHVEMPVFVPFGFSDHELEVLRAPYRQFFLMLMEKYAARPHFGKNDNAFFQSPIVKKRLQSSLTKFNAALQSIDQSGTFNNDFLRSVGVK